MCPAWVASASARPGRRVLRRLLRRVLAALGSCLACGAQEPTPKRSCGKIKFSDIEKASQLEELSEQQLRLLLQQHGEALPRWEGREGRGRRELLRLARLRWRLYRDLERAAADSAHSAHSAAQ